MRFTSLLAFSLAILIGWGCGGKQLNIFTLEQDRQLGAQVNQEILSNPKEYPVLPEKGNEEIYRYIRGITSKILNSGTVKHKDAFAWEVRIIKDDKTLNAFCTPGGYIYVYSGLIKYLDSEDELAGVMGHEIAHADLRHSTAAMTKQYGLQTLIQIAIGNQAGQQLAGIAAGLAQLKFGRDAESAADTHSVIYLCPTSYEADGAAGFFRKLEAGNSARPPEFLSTHPNPGNRIANIEAQAAERTCSGKPSSKATYARMKSLL